MNNPCNVCKSNGYVNMRLRNLRILEYNIHIVACPMCNGKGYLNESDCRPDRCMSVEQLYQIVA